ncbi:M23 family metallopeptidase, partial [Acinetobacter baumannii]
ILNGIPKQPHPGEDIVVPTGTPVTAPASGVITLAEPDLYFTGGTVIIDHGHGLSSVLVHLSKLLVKAGDPVKQGQVVGKSGMTGRATG